MYSFTVDRRGSAPAFVDKAPYVIAIIELEEGPHMTSNIVGCEIEDVRIGMPVEAVYEDVTDEITLVKFRPRGRRPEVEAAWQIEPALSWAGRGRYVGVPGQDHRVAFDYLVHVRLQVRLHGPKALVDLPGVDIQHRRQRCFHGVERAIDEPVWLGVTSDQGPLFESGHRRNRHRLIDV
ncbi:MAG: OB-fold domain-containing protein [Dehalococcoidia bacterium]|nr:OB-fold domain-containing protein [Dehalococcoidia bacterium]